MKQSKNKFNVIDAIVIVALFFLCALMVYGIVDAVGDSGVKPINVSYVLETEALQSDFTAKVAVGDGVYDARGKYMGKVAAVSTAPAVHMGTDESGKAVTSEIDGYSVMYITVNAGASDSEVGYLVGETNLNTGRRLEVRFPALVCTAQCVSIEETAD